MTKNAAFAGAGLVRLRHAFEDVQRKRAVAERESAPRHNVFEMLGVTHYETWLHSPFLRDLLDPYGNHGQGAVFLRGFVELIARRMDWPCPHIGDWPPRHEWVASLEVDRIDISLRSTREGWLVFVENKIGAAFQLDQMPRYERILDRRKTEFGRRALVLLAPEGFEVPPLVNTYPKITYQADIVPWLLSAIEHVRSARVLSNIEQYVQVARALGVKIVDDTGDLKTLLAQPEYLRLGIDIASVIEQVKQNLRGKFWCAVERQLREGITSLGLGSSWTLVTAPGPAVPFQRYLTPTDRNLGGNRLALGVFHEQTGPRLTYGLGFIDRPVDDWPSELSALRQALMAHDAGGSDSTKNWYVYYRESVDRPGSVEFVERIAQDADAFARRFTELPLDVLRNHQDLVLAAGRALSAAEPT